MIRSRVLTIVLVCGLVLIASARSFAQPVPAKQLASPGAFLGVMVGPAKDTDKGILVVARLPTVRPRKPA